MRPSFLRGGTRTKHVRSARGAEFDNDYSWLLLLRRRTFVFENLHRRHLWLPMHCYMELHIFAPFHGKKKTKTKALLFFFLIFVLFLGFTAQSTLLRSCRADQSTHPHCLRAGCGIWLYQFLIIAYLFNCLVQCVVSCEFKHFSPQADMDADKCQTVVDSCLGYRHRLEHLM